jgi:outer membrane phospholipase A
VLPSLLLDSPAASAEQEALSDTVARHFCAYKPTYFVLGAVERDRTNPTTKFQFSFQTMLLDLSPNDTELDSCAKPIGRHLLHFGYTQKSIWNLYADSAPFEENNYNPELFYSYHVRHFGIGWATFGVEHESNGEGGTDSRSWNRLYGRARWNFKIKNGIQPISEPSSSPGEWYAAFEAKLWWPFDKDDEEVDLAKYIGYGKLRGLLRSREYDWGSVGFDVEVTKGGNPINFDHASIQLGASYRHPPFSARVKFVPFFYVQYFEGYGETLIRANEHTRAFRAGLKLTL